MTEPTDREPAALTPFDQCSHPAAWVKEGPRVPLRWGSGPTDICTACGGWRSTLHRPGWWRPGPVKSRRTAEEDEEL